MAFDIDLTFSAKMDELTASLRQLLNLSVQTGDAVKKTNTAIQTESRKSAVEATKVETAFKNTAAAIAAINTDGVDAFTSDLKKQTEAINESAAATDELQKEADALVATLLQTGLAGAKSSAQIITAINKEALALEGLIEARLLSSDPKDQQRLNVEILKQTNVIKGLKAEYEKLNDVPGPDKQTEGFKRLQIQIRAAEAEAQRLGEIYGTTDERFLEAAKGAAVLREQLDDVKQAIAAQNPEQKFKAFETAVGGVIGSFQALTGAIQLFGGESEEVQKIAQKLQGLFNFSQGINTLFTLKDSFANLLGVLGLTTRATVANTVATTAQGTAVVGTTGAIIAEETATVGATAATNRFTAALLANPFTAIAVALAAIVAAIVIYSETADDAAEKQGKLNAELEKNIETLRLYSSELTKASDARINATKDELDLAKALDAPLNERIRLERELAKQRLEAALQLAAFRGDEVDNIGILQAKLTSLTLEYDRLKNAGTDPEILKLKEEELKLLQGQVTEIENIIKGVKEARKEFVTTNAETNKLDISNQLEQVRARYRIQLAEAREGSAQELKAKLDALALEEKAQIDALNNDASRENERLAIIAETNKKRLELENEYLIERLNAQKTADEVALLQVKKNSDAELELKVNVLEDERKIALSELGITESEKLKIRLETEKKISDLRREYAQAEIERSINFEKRDAQLRLTLAEENSIAELHAKKDLITSEEELEIGRINKSLLNEAEYTQQVKLIQAKARSDREKLDRESFERQLNFELSFAKASSDVRLQELQRQLSDENTGSLTRKKLQQEVLDEQFRLIEIEKAANIDKYNSMIISQEEYNLQRKKLEGDASANTAAQLQLDADKYSDIFEVLGLDLSDKMKSAISGIQQNLSSALDSFITIRQGEIDAAKAQNADLLASIEESISATSESINQEIELAKLGYANNVDAKRAELEALNKLRFQGLENQKKIQKEEERLARLQIVIDAAKQASSITVAAANLFESESTKGVAGIVIAVGALSLLLSTFLAFKASAAAASKPQSFGGGGTLDSGTLKGHSHNHPSKGMRIEGTNIFVEGEEEIIRKKSAKKYRKVLKAINDDDFSELTYEDVKHLINSKTEKEFINSREDIISVRKMHKYSKVLKAISEDNFSDLDFGDIKNILRSTNINLRPDISTDIMQDRVMLQTINQNAIISAETEPLRKELISVKEEIKALRRESNKKEDTTVYPDGTVVERKGNTTNIIRPA